jgi:hypothetical protein
MRFYKIDKNYSIIPWDEQKIKKNIYSLNFLSRIKPWLKHPFIEWIDERIWINISKKIFKKNKFLNDLFQYYMFYSLWDLINNLNKYKKDNLPYNTEFMKNPKTKSLYPFLYKKLKNKKIDDFDKNEIKQLNDYLYKFVKYLDTQKIFNFNTSYL